MIFYYAVAVEFSKKYEVVYLVLVEATRTHVVFLVLASYFGNFQFGGTPFALLQFAGLSQSSQQTSSL